MALYVVRGLSGSGKSTLANIIAHGLGSSPLVCEADDYFVASNGDYNFDPSKLSHAHANCLERATKELNGHRSVIVSNTGTQRWEFQPYLEVAEECLTRIIVVDLFDNGMTDYQLSLQNRHGVSEDVISKQRARYEHDWRNADPRKPWERK